MARRWTAAEDEVLRRRCESETWPALAAFLDKNLRAVEHRAKLLGLVKKRGSAVERFWERVSKTTDGCWLWSGGHAGGKRRPNWIYGVMMISGQQTLAHRFSYEIHIGKIPPGAMVCHKCDVPRCVRPDHLFLGSSKDNIADRQAKGRSARGEAIGNSKLSAQEVVEIKMLVAANVGYTAIGRRFGVSHQAVRNIARKNTWSHVA